MIKPNFDKKLSNETNYTSTLGFTEDQEKHMMLY